MRLCLWLMMALALPLRAQDRAHAKEAALGAQLSAQVAQRTKPLDSPAALDYVRQLGQHLASGFAAPAFIFAVIAGNSGGAAHEPISLPGGYIFVSAPLFLAVQDEGEFAGMLAHAMAHVEASHSSRQAIRGGLTQSQTMPLVFMGGGEGYAMNQGANMAIPLSFLNFQRQSELEADRLAVRAMSEAGFDPAALARYIGRVQSAEDPTQTPAISPLSTRDRRVAALAEAIQELPARAYSPSDAFQHIQDEVRRRMPAPLPPPTLHR